MPVFSTTTNLFCQIDLSIICTPFSVLFRRISSSLWLHAGTVDLSHIVTLIRPKASLNKKQMKKKNNVLTAGKVRFDIWTCQGLSLPRPVWLVCTKQLNFGSTPQVLTNISLVQVGILIKQIKRQWFSHKTSVLNDFVVLSVGKCYWTMSREKKPRNPSEPHFYHFCLPLFVQILAAPPLLLSQVDGWRHNEMEKENTF